MRFRSLGVARKIVESAGIEITYVYDDFIFLEHTAFIIQFSEDRNTLITHINVESDKEEVINSINLMNNEAGCRGMSVVREKYFTLMQAEEDNIRLEFTAAKG